MLVLASQSPRRQELLRNAGLEFTTCPADVPEVLGEGEGPTEFARRLARDKAIATLERIAQFGDPKMPQHRSLPLCPEVAALTSSVLDGSLRVLGADTVVIVDEHILGKPQDKQDAARMLRLLSGRRHQVTTGVCLLGQDFEDVRAETTDVTFQELSDDDIRAYIETGEPMDKAGAYAIQGIASRWIPRIEGCYFNVVGLPVSLVCRMLREHEGR
ncbi:MAG TPA: Maf family protein [Terriglobales bacterium]|nr:Maf family protein [Terriglobales bacterium]